MTINNKDFRVKHGLVVEQDASVTGNLSVANTTTSNIYNVGVQVVFPDSTIQTTAYTGIVFDTANAAYNQANSSNVLAQAAFDRANTQSDWNADSSSNAAFILNKPTIPTTLDSLTDTTISGPITGQILTYSSALEQWINQAPAITSNNFTTGYFGGFYSANTLPLSSTTTAYVVV